LGAAAGVADGTGAELGTGPGVGRTKRAMKKGACAGVLTLMQLLPLEFMQPITMQHGTALHGAVTEKEFPEGISSGMGRALTFLLPAGVYSRFTVLAGLHPELGAQGHVEFTIIGDGKTLATAVITGAEPAKAMDCEVAGISELQLTLSSKGGDPKSNYAIWADPVLQKP
jgi:hypothetical protein